MNKIRIGIIGYGNIGRGVEAAIGHNADCELAGVFTRRDPQTVKIASDAKVYAMDELPVPLPPPRGGNTPGL